MVKNPTELVIVIRKCEMEIYKMERSKNLYPFRNNLILTKELDEKILILQRRILGYIKYYKELTKENYLDHIVFDEIIQYIDHCYSKKYNQPNK